jgi:hypothetical protein
MRSARRWAEAHDPRDALEWSVQQPVGNERKFAVRSAFRQWAQRDRAAALAWAAAIPESDRAADWLAPVVAMYVAMVSWQDAEEAIAWAQHIPDDAQREAALVTIARRWRDRDPARAEAWLAASPLSEEARARARQSAATPHEEPSVEETQSDPLTGDSA